MVAWPARLIRHSFLCMAVVSSAGEALALDANAAYQIRQAVERQERNLQEAERSLRELEVVVAKAKYLPAFNDNGVAAKLEAVRAEMDRVAPGEPHAGIDALRERVAAAESKLAHLREQAQPALAAYDRYTNMKHYPDYAEDLERTKGLLEMYRDSAGAFGNAGRARDLSQNLAQVIEYVNGNGTKYAPLVNFKTPEGKVFGDYQARLVKSLVAYMEARKHYRAQAPAGVREAMAKAREVLGQARQQNRPAYLEGGVRQHLDEAGQRLAVYAAVADAEDAELETVRQELAALEAEVAQVRQDMEQAIVAATRAPADNYRGGDAEAMREAVRAAWQNTHANDEILAVRLPTQGWERSAGYEWSGAYKRWERYDRQVLGAMVVIAVGEEHAMLYPAFVNRDNLAGRDTIGVAKDSGYVVRKMLRANLR